MRSSCSIPYLILSENSVRGLRGNVLIGIGAAVTASVKRTLCCSHTWQGHVQTAPKWTHCWLRQSWLSFCGRQTKAGCTPRAQKFPAAQKMLEAASCRADLHMQPEGGCSTQSPNTEQGQDRASAWGTEPCWSSVWRAAESMRNSHSAAAYEWFYPTGAEKCHKEGVETKCNELITVSIPHPSALLCGRR